jgi:hypothetical protein
MERKNPENTNWSSIDESMFESYEPAMLNDWVIKTSTYGEQIQMFAYNIHSGITIIRWFTSRGEAGEWLEHLTDI